MVVDVVDLHLAGVRGLSLSFLFIHMFFHRTSATLHYQSACYGRSPHVERSLGIRAHYYLGVHYYLLVHYYQSALLSRVLHEIGNSPKLPDT